MVKCGMMHACVRKMLQGACKPRGKKFTTSKITSLVTSQSTDPLSIETNAWIASIFPLLPAKIIVYMHVVGAM